jgi:hypothetical protein
MTGQVGETQLPPGRADDQGRGWYRGDLHVHSARSHGAELAPGQLTAAARASGLDFIAITEHNTADTHDAFGQLASDDLLVVLGQEVVTQTGHWLALGIGPGQVVEWRYGVRHGVIGQHASQVRQAGGLCVAAHPHAPYPGGVFMYPFEGFDAVEVWNGLWSSDRPWNADNGAATAEWGRALVSGAHGGRWLPAIGGSAGIGGHLETRGEEAVVCAVVGGVPSGTVSFHTDHGTARREQLPAEGQGSVEWHTSAGETLFVRVEVHHPGQQMAALTNPVFLS